MPDYNAAYGEKYVMVVAHPMNVILQRITELFELADQNEKKGLYFHAVERYNRIAELLMVLVVSRDAGQITLSVDEEQELMRIREFLFRHLPELFSKMHNGQSGGTMGAKARDTAEEAMFDIMDELLAELKG